MTSFPCPVCESNLTDIAFSFSESIYRRCSRCRSLFQHEFFPSSDINDYYENGYHEARGHGGFSTDIEKAKRKTFAYFLRHLSPSPTNNHLLEVGCGTGDASAVAAQMGYEVTGLDLSRAAIRIAQSRHPDVNWVAGDIIHSGYADASFSAIVLFDAIEHFVNPRSLADALVRLLQPGGQLLLVTPNADSLTARWLQARWFHIMQEHVILFTPLSLQLLFGNRGLVLQRNDFAWKWINFDMLRRHADIHRNIAGGNVLARLLNLLPASMARLSFPFNIGEMLIVFGKPPDTT